MKLSLVIGFACLGLMTGCGTDSSGLGTRTDVVGRACALAPMLEEIGSVVEVKIADAQPGRYVLDSYLEEIDGSPTDAAWIVEDVREVSEAGGTEFLRAHLPTGHVYAQYLVRVRLVSEACEGESETIKVVRFAH